MSAPAFVTVESAPYLAATLPPQLRALVQPGHQVAIEERDGRRHTTLVCPGERWALQTWEALPLPAEPEAEAPAPPSEAPPPINRDSTTAEVAAWVKSRGWRGSVIGRWVWVPAHQPGKAEPDPALMRAAGFGYSKTRGQWYHTCGVEGVKPPKGRKRWGGKLERYHNAASVQDFKAGAFDPRAAWLQRKDRKKRRA